MSERDIFTAALQITDRAAQLAYLDKAGAGDEAMRRRVELLLRTHSNVGDYLERPAVEQMAPALARTEPGGDDGNDALGFLQPSTRPDSMGRLDHYEILEVLGRGGFGVVLKVFDDVLHRVVAIKVLSPQLASTSPARKRFLREARAAAAIRHDNVVGIHAIEEQPIPYLVMEYIAGETLQQKLDRSGPLETSEVLRIGQQIASGLAAAHALGLIHRDIKPANILLESGVEQRVKITDFGLARAADDASLTQSGVVAGTPMYMAPEQARGEAIDQRADLFSLGSVLYVTCSGRPPFRASTTLAVLKRVAEDAPRPIQEIIPEVPNWLCAIVARLHAKKPEDRFASAKEAADLLARHLAKLQQDRGRQPLSDVPPPAPKPAPAVREPTQSASPKIAATPALASAVRPSLPRKGRWVAAAAAAVFLLLAGLGLSEATGVTDVRGTVIRLFSPEGTLVVEVDDPEVSVTIDGGEMVITGAGAKEIRLKPGQYKVQASKDGKLVSQELVTVTKNGRQVVRVSKEGTQVADAATGDKPGAAQTPNPPARQALDLKYIPADASGAVVIHPRRILQSPLAAAALPPASADEMVKELGVKPEQIEQVIVLLQPGAAAPEPTDAPVPGETPPDPTPIPGAVIRFAEPVGGKAVLTHLLKGLREESHDGKTYYRSSTGEALLGLPLAGAIPDTRTVLLAPEPVLRKMLLADGDAKSPLLDCLRQSDVADDITGVVLIEPHRALLKTLSAGFNDAQGMNSNPVPGSPYPLDSEGKQGGVGEPGWAGPWSTPSSPKFAFQKKVVHEGDGALYMSKVGADRRLAESQRGSFGVEMFVQAPERGGFLCYLNNASLPFRDGPVWSVKDGKFLVLDGPDNFRETGFTAQPGKWHKVVLRVDVSSKEWQFFVDDTMFDTTKPLHFRSAKASLDTIRFQCETEVGIYIDALHITRLPDGGKKP